MAEMKAGGYDATDLGDLGFFPIEPSEVKSFFDSEDITMMGAFVELSLSEEEIPPEQMENLERVAAIQATFVDGQEGPYSPHIVLADNGDSPERQRHSGRIKDHHKMSVEARARFAANTNSIERHMWERYRLPVYFHPHCGSRVETLDEIQWFVANTSMDLVIDTGHLVYASRGTVDLLEVLDLYASRIGTFHFKDISLRKMEESAEKGWSYLEAVKNGLVVNLGSEEGSIDFPRIVEWQREVGYEGFVCVEQETYDPVPAGLDMLKNKLYLDQLYQL